MMLQKFNFSQPEQWTVIEHTQAFWLQSIVWHLREDKQRLKVHEIQAPNGDNILSAWNNDDKQYLQ